MPKRKPLESPIEVRELPPAFSLEEREDQMIAAAFNLAEKRLLDGSASATEVVHFLKAGSIRERYERELLKTQNELMKARAEAVQSQKRAEELFEEARKVFAGYSGKSFEEDDEDYGDKVVFRGC